MALLMPNGATLNGEVTLNGGVVTSPLRTALPVAPTYIPPPPQPPPPVTVMPAPTVPPPPPPALPPPAPSAPDLLLSDYGDVLYMAKPAPLVAPVAPMPAPVLVLAPPPQTVNVGLTPALTVRTAPAAAPTVDGRALQSAPGMPAVGAPVVKPPLSLPDRLNKLRELVEQVPGVVRDIKQAAQTAPGEVERARSDLSRAAELRTVLPVAVGVVGVLAGRPVLGIGAALALEWWARRRAGNAVTV